MNRYLFESRKKTFKKTMKSNDILKQIANNRGGSLLKTKKQKNSHGFFVSPSLFICFRVPDEKEDEDFQAFDGPTVGEDELHEQTPGRSAVLPRDFPGKSLFFEEIAIKSSDFPIFS